MTSHNSSYIQLSKKYAAREVERPLLLLKPKEKYLVLAIEYPSDASHAQFWVLGERSIQLRNNGIFFPDIINANECEISDPTIPINWRIGVFHYKSGTRTIIGPPEVITVNFLERLSNSEPEMINIFENLLAEYRL